MTSVIKTVMLCRFYTVDITVSHVIKLSVNHVILTDEFDQRSVTSTAQYTILAY